MYRSPINRAAAGSSWEPSSVLQAATPKHYGNLKKQLAARHEGGWARVAWKLAQQPMPTDVHLLQARLLMMDPKARPLARRAPCVKALSALHALHDSTDIHFCKRACL